MHPVKSAARRRSGCGFDGCTRMPTEPPDRKPIHGFDGRTRMNTEPPKRNQGTDPMDAHGWRRSRQKETKARIRRTHTDAHGVARPGWPAARRAAAWGVSGRANTPPTALGARPAAAAARPAGPYRPGGGQPQPRRDPSVASVFIRVVRVSSLHDPAAALVSSALAIFTIPQWHSCRPRLNHQDPSVWHRRRRPAAASAGSLRGIRVSSVSSPFPVFTIPQRHSCHPRFQSSRSRSGPRVIRVSNLHDPAVASVSSAVRVAPRAAAYNGRHGRPYLPQLHRRPVAPRGDRTHLREPQSGQHGGPHRALSGLRESRRRGRHRRRGPRLRQLASRPGPGPGGDALPGGPDDRGAQGRVRPRHDARDGQGPQRDPRRRPGSHRHDVLHGGRGAPACSGRRCRPSCANKFAMSIRQPVGVCGRHHAVELPDGDSRRGRSSRRSSAATRSCSSRRRRRRCPRSISSRCWRMPASRPGVVNMVTGDGDEVGTPLTTSPAIRVVSFTGSTRRRPHRQSQRPPRRSRKSISRWAARTSSS